MINKFKHSEVLIFFSFISKFKIAFYFHFDEAFMSLRDEIVPCKLNGPRKDLEMQDWIQWTVCL